MATAKVFMSGRSQAVRLPKEFRVSENELTIARVGSSLVLTPVKPGWGDFFQALDEFEPGRPLERDQPLAQQQRDFPCEK